MICTFVKPSRTSAEAIQASEYANTILQDAARDLRFEPAEHRYFLGDRELRSVSSIVEAFAPFDAAAKAASCSKNPRHEFYGWKPEDIVAAWKERGNVASEAGTEIHEFGEACCLIKSGHAGQMDTKFAARLTRDGLAAITPKEAAAARWWNDLDLDRYAVVAKETRIANPVFGYAGTFDLLLYDLKDRCYALRDYKTNGDLFRWFGGHLKAPLSPIKDDDHGKYTLQQNLYRIQLENMGLHVGSMSLVWLKEDGTYENVVIENKEKLVRFAMTRYNSTFNN